MCVRWMGEGRVFGFISFRGDRLGVLGSCGETAVVVVMLRRVRDGGGGVMERWRVASCGPSDAGLEFCGSLRRFGGRSGVSSIFEEVGG
jgi:hypothetical protein